jgi:DNA repair protein RadC
MLGGAYLWKEQHLMMPAVEKKSDNIVAFPTKSETKLEYHPTIHDMPSEERPRERLRNYGARVLSNAELLAIILRTGTTQDNVIELAGKLLHKYNGFGGLLRAEFMELCAEYGLGEAKTAQLKAALEIGRRLGIAQNDEKYQIKAGCLQASTIVRDVLVIGF